MVKVMFTSGFPFAISTYDNKIMYKKSWDNDARYTSTDLNLID